MPLVPLDIPEGMLLNGTEYESSGRWRNGNLIRFFRGSPQPVGGWNALPLSTRDEDSGFQTLDELLGVCRGMFTWRDLDQKRWIVIGTTHRLYVHDGSELFDITPSALPTGDDNAIFGTGYSAFIYNDEDYGDERSTAISSKVQEPGSWTFDNWGEDLIACPNWDGKLYKWSPGDTVATQITNGAGEVTEACRAIVVSNERHLIAIGAGDYSTVWNPDQRKIAWSDSEDYTTWTATVTNSAGDLQLDTSGLAIVGKKFKNEILIWTDIDLHRLTYLGPPYYYGLRRISPTAGCYGITSVVATADFMFWVGPQGFMIYDGSVREISSEISEFFLDNLTDDSTQYSKISCGHNPKFNEIWIFYSSQDSVEVDSCLIWNYETNVWSKAELARSCWNEANIWGYPIATEPRFQEQVDDREDTFTLTGHDVWQKMFRLDNSSSYRSLAVESVVIKNAAETVTYVESTDYEIDEINGLVKVLSTGSIGSTDTIHLDYDITQASYSLIYNHEQDYTDDGASRTVWLKSAPIEIAAGDNLAVVTRVYQDTGREDDDPPPSNSDAVEVYFETRLAPEAALITEGPYTIDTDRGYTDVRFTARQVAIKVVQTEDVLWRLGRFRLDIRPGSGR